MYSRMELYNLMGGSPELFDTAGLDTADRHGLFDTSPPAARRLFPSSVTEPAGGFMVCDTWNNFFRVLRSCGQGRQMIPTGQNGPPEMVSLNRKDGMCDATDLFSKRSCSAWALAWILLASIVSRLFQGILLSIRRSHACANRCVRLCASPLCLDGLDAPRDAPSAHASVPLLNRQRGGVAQDRGAVRQGGTVRGAGTQPCRLVIRGSAETSLTLSPTWKRVVYLP